MPQMRLQGLIFKAALVGTSRCDVPAREAAGGIIAPLNAARTAQRAIPTRFKARGFEPVYIGRHLMNLA